MKKFTLVLAFIGMIMLQGCTKSENVTNTVLSKVYEVRNVNFAFNANNGYSIYQTLNPHISPSDVLLIYRLSGTINPSTPIWQQIPRTLYLPQGELDYDFDFSKEDFTIYAGGTYDLSLTPNYITNQTFRLVIIPGYASNKAAAKNVDYSDYKAVIEAFHIDDSNSRVLNE